MSERTILRVLVCVNERESVTKFHFPFWQRRALPVRRHLNATGWQPASSKYEFLFLIWVLLAATNAGLFQIVKQDGR